MRRKTGARTVAFEDGLEIVDVAGHSAARRMLLGDGLRLVGFSTGREIWHPVDTRVGLFDYLAENGTTVYRVCLPDRRPGNGTERGT